MTRGELYCNNIKENKTIYIELYVSVFFISVMKAGDEHLVFDVVSQCFLLDVAKIGDDDNCSF